MSFFNSIKYLVHHSRPRKKAGEIRRFYLKYALDILKGILFYKNKPKYFIIGRNKSGTSSVKHAFIDLGFQVGDQRKAERLAPCVWNGNFKPLIRYCRTATVFKDTPFSWPNVYKELDKAFPNAKFILTVRDSADQWYNSFINYQTKIFGKTPTIDDLKNSSYVWKGWRWENRQLPLENYDDIWNKDLWKNHYLKHNEDVKEYFKDKPHKLLVLNLAEKDAYKKFCAFIGVKPNKEKFPWKNKT